MPNPSSIFSSYDYFRNPQFQRLMRNWNKYMTFDGEASEDLMFEWEETLLNDFLYHAREYLKENNYEWKFGLE